MAFSLVMANRNISSHEFMLGGATWRFRHPSGGNRGLVHLDCRALPRSTPVRTSDQRPDDARIFEQYLYGKVRRINDALELAVPMGHPLRIYESMRHTLLAPAKRVAPILCLASCELVGGDESIAMPTACAIEMVHTMSLIHDDLPCLDNDDLRRGKPANHVAFDEGTALLAGDALLALAFNHMSRTEDVPACQVLHAVSELSCAAGSGGIPSGQVLDMMYEGRKDFSLSELECIHIHKTAIFMAGTVCGAVIGGGDEDEIESLRELGKTISLLYQVVDDVLDVTGSSKELGKKTGRDKAKDKATFPKLMGIDGAMKYAYELSDEVLHGLSCFDHERSTPLRQLTSFIVSRMK